MPPHSMVQGPCEQAVLTGGDTLDTTATGETADGGLGYALDVVAKDLPVALGPALSEALATFSACVDALA